MRIRVAVALLVLVVAGPASADGPSAKEIVDAARDRSALNLSGARAKLRFFVTEAGGGTRERVFTSAAKKIGGKTHTVMRFLAPPEVAGIAMRVVENPGADAEQSLYLPKLRRVRKVAAAQKGQRFLDTDLTFGDLAGTGLVEGSYQKLADGVVEGQACFVLEGVPTGESPYGKVKVFIHKTLFVALQAEFFGKDGKLLKSYRVRKLKEIEPGRYVAMDSVLEAAAGGKTEITILELELKAQLPDDDFTERALER